MDINFIRQTGAILRREIFPRLRELEAGPSFGKGAGGDVTHLIDKRVEDIIIRELEGLREPVTLISEECGTREFSGGGVRLLIDPIDGSRNAVSGIPVFSTSIALVEGDSVGSTIAGYVINIVSGDEYWAEKGKGAFINGVPMKTQQNDECRVVAYEAQTPGRDIERILPLLSKCNRARCFGSTALDMAFLAQGAVSVFVVPSPSRSFDFAGGYLLVKEAGGMITDIGGNVIEDIPIGVKRTSTLLAAATSSLHQKAIQALNYSNKSINYRS
jgi:myo-inositol-1(or 4)-monophosphatase